MAADRATHQRHQRASVQHSTRLTGSDTQYPGVGDGRRYRVLDALVSILQRNQPQSQPSI